MGLAVDDILSEHARWLSSDGSEGSRAKIAGEFLKGHDLTGRNLDRAEFDHCDLTNTRFDSAHLNEAVFTSCSLAGAGFRNASLRGARFVDCSGLTAKQLAGANLEAATLPQSAADFPNLKRLSEISKSSNTLLVSVLGACVTSIVALASASDASLVANSGSLPVLGTTLTVPMAVFAVAMPTLVLALWIYFLLTLQQVWEEFADLPEIFPDGEPRYRKAELWLIGSYVRGWPAASKLASVEGFRLLVFHLLTWVLVPTIAFAAWAIYLRRHDWVGTWILTAITTIGVFGAVFFSTRGRATLNSANRRLPQSIRLAGLAVLVPLPLVLIVLSDAAINASRPADAYSELDSWTRRVGLAVLQRFHIRTELRIRETSLSEDQKHLRGRNISRIDGYQLNAAKVDLRDANIIGAFLREATLNEARLENANLQFAFLSEASLAGARLDWAKMELSTAIGANFSGAQMSRTRLIEATLRRADFSAAHLAFSDFGGADLQGAVFRGADLEYASLYMADLRGADFTGAKNVDKIKCISRANIAGVIGLRYGGINGASEAVAAEDDDDYRRALARDRGIPACGSEFPDWGIEGPPVIRKSFSPRSLRLFEVDIAHELPRHLQRDVTIFLRVLQKTNAREMTAVFDELKRELDYVAPEMERKPKYTLTAERRGDVWESISLIGGPVGCNVGIAGFKFLLVPYGGFRSRLDLDKFVSSILGTRGEELGTERRWSLNGGFVSEKADRGLGPREISYSRCS